MSFIAHLISLGNLFNSLVLYKDCVTERTSPVLFDEDFESVIAAPTFLDGVLKSSKSSISLLSISYGADLCLEILSGGDYY